MSYIGMDIGTSGCKAGIVDGQGEILASAYREYSLSHPEPGWVELDPAILWNCAKEVLAELAPAAGDAKAIAVSSIGESIVLTDKEDNVLGNSSVYLDTRCESVMPIIMSRLDPLEACRHTGVPLGQVYSLIKLIWLERNMPWILEKTAKVFLFAEYFSYMLCGERAVDPSNACRTMMLDLKRRAWSGRMMELFGVNKDLFAPIQEPGTLLGKIRPVLADELGLSRDLEVRVGCHDQTGATLGSGTLNPGDMFIGMGSSESLNVVIDKDGITERLIANNLSIEPFFENRYFVSAAQPTHGTSIRWFAQLFRDQLERQKIQGEQSIYQTADRLCAQASGAVRFLPYMSGVDFHHADHGAKGCFVGLDISVDPWQMYRALLEGLCLETRARFEMLVESGSAVGTIIAAGGATKSDLLMQMKADVLGHPLRILSSAEVGINGMGMICATACGDYANYREAAARFVQPEKEYFPQKDYSELYWEYRIIKDSVNDMYKKLK